MSESAATISVTFARWFALFWLAVGIATGYGFARWGIEALVIAFAAVVLLVMGLALAASIDSED